MPDFLVFYYRHRTGDMIDSFDPQPMPLMQIVALAGNVLENTGDFLGLVDDDDGLMQFMYLAQDVQDKRPIRMEIPDMAHQGYYTRNLSIGELSTVLRGLPDKLTVHAVPGLQFERRVGCVPAQA